MSRHPFRGAYLGQRVLAKARGIEFLLTFEEWLKIWVDSGHLHERGKRSGQYVMARFGDKGPYALGNVKIITTNENGREGSLGNKHNLGRKHDAEFSKKLSLRMKGKRYALGRKLTEEHKQKISQFHKGNKYNLGRKHSAETRAKMSQRLLGNKHTLGKKLSEEHKQKIRETLRGRVFSEETKKKISQAKLGHRHTQATKDKVSKANAGNKYRVGCKHDYEAKAKMREARLRWWAAKKQNDSKLLIP